MDLLSYVISSTIKYVVNKYIVEEMTVIAPAVDRTRNPDHKGRDVWVTGVLSTVVASITP